MRYNLGSKFTLVSYQVNKIQQDNLRSVIICSPYTTKQKGDKKHPPQKPVYG